MERNVHSRVYINPNFKRAETDPWPIKPIQTTHFNRHYLEEKPNMVTNANINSPILNNRKIYVNPNFINGNNVTQCIPSIPMTSANENLNNVPRQVLHKSKYSLVHNVQTPAVKKEQAFQETQKNYFETSSDANQIAQKPTQEVPLTRSRYCIIRKKKKLSISTSNSVNNNTTDLGTVNKYPVQMVSDSSNQLTCNTNLNAYKTTEKNKVSCKTENIPKIKVTKYKLMPISYLKKNKFIETNKNKYLTVPLKSYKNNPKLRSSLIICNRNRFKFTKTSTPMKSSTPVNKATSRITQYKERVLLNNVTKAKLSRTKFNINNIPCRLFTKYGKCLRQVQGNCYYLHDKKHVSLCHKFLKGICHDKNCTLSHELSHKKMPTCYFYLKGVCTKESCPYLHVKLSDKTKICREFLKGYCESGDKCTFRHVKIDKMKKSKKESNSFQSSQKVTHMKQLKTAKKSIKNSDIIKDSDEIVEKDVGDCRYYNELVNKDDSYENIKPTRCKLGTLPSFIQL